MEIDVNRAKCVPIELRPAEGNINVQQSAPIPVSVSKAKIDIQPQQANNIGIDIVNKVAFGSGVIIVKTEAEYISMWEARTLDEKKWYVLYATNGDLEKIWIGRKLFARKSAEGEKKTNVFPLVFPIVF